MCVCGVCVCVCVCVKQMSLDERDREFKKETMKSPVLWEIYTSTHMYCMYHGNNQLNLCQPIKPLHLLHVWS